MNTTIIYAYNKMSIARLKGWYIKEDTTKTHFSKFFFIYEL